LVISLYLFRSFAHRCYPALVEGPAGVLRRFALAWRRWRERKHAAPWKEPSARAAPAR